MPDVSEHETIDSLLRTATPEAAASLQALVESAADKETRKAAKRALYLLSQKGIAAASVPKTPAMAAKPAAREAIRTYASNFDGAGDRLLWFILPDPDGGSPTLFSAMMRDDVGVRDGVVVKQTRRQLEARFLEVEGEIDRGLVLAEIEPDYARYLLQQAREVNRQTMTPTPAGFLAAYARVGEAEQQYETAPVYARLTPEALLADIEIPHDAEVLFDLIWFDAWFLDMEIMYPALGRWVTARFETPDASEEEKQERADRALHESAVELMTPDRCRVYQHRLEATADVLLRRGEEQAAKQALFHALKLAESGAAESDFALRLVARSIEATREMMQAEIARDRSAVAQKSSPESPELEPDFDTD